ncbi:MAG TPA: YitT family protein [Candidatus Dorea gallistercoris]|uniref:YitT family protein n=1 Tax=Candidatus Dorea gallistercoris TaxID=2838542 RepID=A0A9D1UFN4_9FIRM|nr:YitT family protein [Candidatus Dorea gallistercoris]
MKKEIRKEFWIDLLADLAAGALIAAGIYNFALNADFPVAGFSGIAVILYHLIGLPVGAGTVLLNVPVAVFCYRYLGKKFFLKSVKTTLIVSILTDYVAPLFPIYTGERFLAAICTGVLCGLGYALAFLRGSSTGGQDFISLSVRKMNPHVPLGTITFVQDAAIIFLGFILVFRDMDGLIYGVIVTWLLASVINKVLYGSGQGRLALIVTEQGGRMARQIGQEFDRSATILEGTGAYSGKKKEVVVCACESKQIHGLKRMAHQLDPEAFTIVLESNEVVGEGFQGKA